MAPPGERSGPAPKDRTTQQSVAANDTATIADLTDNPPTAAPRVPAQRRHHDPVPLSEALDQLEADLHDREHLLHLGYSLGYFTGLHAGARAAEEDIERAWAATAQRVRALASVPTQAKLMELRRRDDSPCHFRCHRCSTCVRADWLARHGHDFIGGDR